MIGLRVESVLRERRGGRSVAVEKYVGDFVAARLIAFVISVRVEQRVVRVAAMDSAINVPYIRQEHSGVLSACILPLDTGSKAGMVVRQTRRLIPPSILKEIFNLRCLQGLSLMPPHGVSQSAMKATFSFVD